MATKSKFQTGKEAFVAKPTHDIRLDRLAASRAAIATAKAKTITLKDFIAENYHFAEGEDKIGHFKCTIKDIGLHPFEIDIYDARIILVEVTGKTRKDFGGRVVPERLYRGRNYNMASTLADIATIMAQRKIQGGESTVITLRDYHNAYAGFYKYVSGIVSKDYAKALAAMEAKFPFTQLSEDSDEESWFKSKE